MMSRLLAGLMHVWLLLSLWHSSSEVQAHDTEDSLTSLARFTVPGQEWRPVRGAARDITKEFVAAHEPYARNHGVPGFVYSEPQSQMAMALCMERRSAGCVLTYPMGKSANMAVYNSEASAEVVVSGWYNQIVYFDFNKNVEENVNSVHSCSREISNFIQIVTDYPSRGLGCCEIPCGEQDSRYLYVCTYDIGAGAWEQHTDPNVGKIADFQSLVGTVTVHRPKEDMTVPFPTVEGHNGCVSSTMDSKETASAAVTKIDRTWRMNPDPIAVTDVGCDHSLQHFASNRLNSKTLVVRCPNGCEETSFDVWGVGVFKGDSSLCRAGIHAGVIPTVTGGLAKIEVLGGMMTYSSATQHGVTSQEYGLWPRSFKVEAVPDGLHLGVCVAYEERYTQPLKDIWQAVDQPETVTMPAGWSILYNLNGRLTVITQRGAIHKAIPDGDSHLGSMLILKEATCHEGSVSTDVYLSGGEQIGIVFRYRDPNNFYIFDISHSEKFKRIRKRINGIWTTVTRMQDDGIGQNQWHNIKVIFDNTKIRGFMDDVEVLSARDASIKDGSVGLTVWNVDTVFFDKIELKPL